MLKKRARRESRPILAASAHYSANRLLTEASRAMRERVSPMMAAQETWRIFGQAWAAGESGMVSVTTSSSRAELEMRSIAAPESTGCVM